MTETETRLREYEADLVVESYESVADDVVTVTLVHPEGKALPEWTPGAHIDLILTPEITRQYSLCGSPADSQRLMVGVLRDEHSRGGSAFVHDQVRKGSTVRIRGPRNHFPLVDSPRYLFIAGGIGITPMMPMIAEAAFAMPESWSIEIPVEASGGQHVEILQNFTNAILKGEKLLSPAEQGIHSVELANAILLSTWQDKTIELPMSSADYERLLVEKGETSTFQKTKVVAKASADDFAKSFR